MRPRHFAEEIRAAAVGRQRVAGASMRPRHFAEEIGEHGAGDPTGEKASMRPRHFAEEIPARPSPGPGTSARFNEASAFRRGNQRCDGNPRH